MPRVLMLARHFPPIGGAGVHRTLGSVRHLPEHGYEPVVVTGPAEHRDRWNPRDADLLSRVPHGIRVHRLAGPEPAGRTGAAARAERLLQIPPPWTRWWVEHAFRAGVREGHGVDLVYASCLPYETAFAAARVAAALGVPWVADLEDPWALDEMWMRPSRVHHAVELRAMRKVLSTAAAVVMAAPEAAARVRRAFPELADRPVEGIPIGFEPDDFPATAPVGEAPQRSLRVVHTGSMHTDLGLRVRRTRLRRRLLGGTFPGVDPLTRSHAVLVRAVASESDLRGRVELHLAGDLTPGDRAVGSGHEFVREHGLLGHRETLALMRSADVLFLPMHDLPPGIRAGLVPYKTFEYLATGRPILAAVPDGDVRDLLSRVAHADVVRPSDAAGMARALRRRLASGPAPDALPPPGLERRESVARIAAVLDAVLGGAPRALAA